MCMSVNVSCCLFVCHFYICVIFHICLFMGVSCCVCLRVSVVVSVCMSFLYVCVIFHICRSFAMFVSVSSAMSVSVSFGVYAMSLCVPFPMSVCVTYNMIVLFPMPHYQCHLHFLILSFYLLCLIICHLLCVGAMFNVCLCHVMCYIHLHMSLGMPLIVYLNLLSLSVLHTIPVSFSISLCMLSIFLPYTTYPCHSFFALPFSNLLCLLVWHFTSASCVPFRSTFAISRFNSWGMLGHINRNSSVSENEYRIR